VTLLRPPTRMGVVIPVRDEAELLAPCLEAVRTASETVGLPVHVVVVLDGCTDGSADVVEAAGRVGASTRILGVAEGNVGAARAAGCAVLLEQYGADGLWLAMTDADSTVGPSWLQRHRYYARAGYDAVAGTVTVDDWSAYSEGRRQAYLSGYRQCWGHGHVHGANLGFAAAAYLSAGGFAALRSGEDVALVAALAEAGCRIAWADDVPVLTSGRRQARAPDGLSLFLQDLPDRVLAEDSGSDIGTAV